MRKKLLLSLLVLALCSPLFVADLADYPVLADGIQDNGIPNGDVVVHLFEWTWDDIAAECPYLDEMGYGAVQVSPPQEHAWFQEDGTYPWWLRYQPVTYQLNSRSGDLAGFQAMVDACHAVNVKVYVDVVINHMTGVSATDAYTAASSGGTSYHPYYANTDPYAASGLHFPEVLPSGWDLSTCGGRCGYGSTDFRYCDYDDGWVYASPDDGLDANDVQDDDYADNRDDRVRRCEVVNLSDLNTSADYVQAVIARYLEYLVSLGVDGFRVDAAKHIRGESGEAGDELAQILAKLETAIGGTAYDDLYIYQEVIEAQGQPIVGSYYTDTGAVTEFQYGQELYRVFTSGDLDWLQWFDESWDCNDGGTWPDCLMSSSSALVFVNNHDNQRGHGGSGVLTYKSGDSYALGNVYMLAWPYGTPRVMSSYAFENDKQGPPAYPNGTTHSVFVDGCLSPDAAPGATSGWVCEHRWTSIAGMVGFHNTTAGEPVTWRPTGNADQIAFSRGAKGFVAINGAGSNLFLDSFSTGLPDGQYCNVIAGEWDPANGGSCSDAQGAPQWVTVSNGRISATVLGQDALALHVAAVYTGSPAQAVLDVLVQGPSSIRSGQPADYTVTLFNTGGAAATNIQVIYEMSGGYEFEGAADGVFACGTPSGYNVTCMLSDLGSGDSAQFTVQGYYSCGSFERWYAIHEAEATAGNVADPVSDSMQTSVLRLRFGCP